MTDAGIPAKNRRDLTRGSIALTMILFALPTLGSSALQSLNGSINAVWVGRFLGEEALAATANGNILMFLLVSFVFGFGMASTILIGQAVGRRDADLARRTIGTALGSIIPLSMLIAAGGWLLAPTLLDLLGTPASAADLALTYLRMIFTAMPATLTFTLFMMALRGTGDSMTPLWFMVVSVGIDLILTPVLILGLGPFPEWGIFGSAFATATANTLALIGMVATIYLRGSVLALRGPELRYLLADRTILISMISKGLPMGLQMIVISSAALTMLSLINREGVQTTAAYGATQQLWTYVQMLAMALSAAASAMAAQNIGAGKWDRVSRITRWGLVFNLLLTGTVVALLTAFDETVLALFLGSDSAAVPIGARIQILATWGYLFFGVAQVLFGTMRANGYVIGPLVVMVISMYPVRLGFAFGFYPLLGADALWLAFPAGMVATALMGAGLYLHGRWRKGRMLPAEEAAQRSEGYRAQAGTCASCSDLAPTTAWKPSEEPREPQAA
ncbi:MATE family efflux transporter [Roseovarius sp. SCSIO 43702]|uniref:MATE family efflux transporter n=1 Tax=Roseovarius sp. SCSIO 43702 TaxID=2823043 RepID=UPI001C732ED7|nr:MATE family efflux transporter [Roseovarius sp. SCSIO 43702]QYX56009.1 MATE family efflux transporter [Roseovarius sp. SCSIO 43702]